MWNMNNDGGGFHASDSGGLHAGAAQQQPWRDRWRKSRLAGAIGNVGSAIGEMSQDAPPPPQMTPGIIDQPSAPMQIPGGTGGYQTPPIMASPMEEEMRKRRAMLMQRGY